MEGKSKEREIVIVLPEDGDMVAIKDFLQKKLEEEEIDKNSRVILQEKVTLSGKEKKEIEKFLRKRAGLSSQKLSWVQHLAEEKRDEVQPESNAVGTVIPFVLPAVGREEPEKTLARGASNFSQVKEGSGVNQGREQEGEREMLPLKPREGEGREKRGLTPLPIFFTSGERMTVWGDENTILVQRTLRCGQSISYDGNVVIIGDVNPGAEVVAGGSIIVMGALRGVAHAGAQGDEKAVVAAFRLQPTQLRIAGYISRSPDGSTSTPEYPEVARVKNGGIVIDSLQPSLEKQLCAGN
ncbi:MAG: septum site-determining protein MinC [Eubacteriales bacterium]|nr:septum site-determining protein MinC [Eubacteriales bacterium]